MHPKEDFRSEATPEFLAFLEEEIHQEPRPLTRAPIRGGIQIAFWGLRIYIVTMLIMVAIGFAHGIH
ncbi:conserved protein of unknown function [Acidithiobacillus ferrivorans]|uniref:Uncharacterized protein n=1 Tax=Acidithiobacillus ferrivorans TaxID=160808 RepID=A0A060USM8_9PROT|nr:hypothetical protein [Acidithiobacillus ferrivorans]MBN6742720.1 hypothetical protein [Acidithiobacillus sp. MC6.1]MBU2849804.1 hypothetical protein [Acidithiobacillus ferrivorans]OCB01675.1 hypothetical protein BBC27_02910 [Acidithiobacillus ferrivorans]QQD72920.1 hypothetical protein H2515_00820 [Acidithiobacillus ferrivorans]CDQ11622.1 conserved hypothetical protein [Acidithiobacillus ferrivorans]